MVYSLCVRVLSVLVMVMEVFNEFTRVSSGFVMVFVVYSLCVRHSSIFVMVLVIFNLCTQVSSGFFDCLGDL